MSFKFDFKKELAEFSTLIDGDIQIEHDNFLGGDKCTIKIYKKIGINKEIIYLYKTIRSFTVSTNKKTSLSIKIRSRNNTDSNNKLYIKKVFLPKRLFLKVLFPNKFIRRKYISSRSLSKLPNSEVFNMVTSLIDKISPNEIQISNHKDNYMIIKLKLIPDLVDINQLLKINDFFESTIY